MSRRRSPGRQRSSQIVTWKDDNGRVRIARVSDDGEVLNPEVLDGPKEKR